MQAQLHKFIAKQEEENVWMREQIAQLCSFYASEAAPNAPSAPTTVPPLHQDGFSYGSSTNARYLIKRGRHGDG